jgi:multidrug transporter EmrE-like cation transporter
MDWGFIFVFFLAAVEVFADFNLRWYAESGSMLNLLSGVGGYGGVIALLLESFKYNNVLYVNGLWDGISGLVESAAAYYILGDRLKNTEQYIGLIMTVAGVALMKLAS